MQSVTPSNVLEQRLALLERRVQELEAKLLPKPTWRDMERERCEQIERQIEEALYEGCQLDLPNDVGATPTELMDAITLAGVPFYRSEHSQKILMSRVLKRMGIKKSRNMDGVYYEGIRPKARGGAKI